MVVSSCSLCSFICSVLCVSESTFWEVFVMASPISLIWLLTFCVSSAWLVAPFAISSTATFTFEIELLIVSNFFWKSSLNSASSPVEWWIFTTIEASPPIRVWTERAILPISSLLCKSFSLILKSIFPSATSSRCPITFVIAFTINVITTASSAQAISVIIIINTVVLTRRFL